jgi:hypothetical protein
MYLLIEPNEHKGYVAHVSYHPLKGYYEVRDDVVRIQVGEEIVMVNLHVILSDYSGRVVTARIEMFRNITEKWHGLATNMNTRNGSCKVALHHAIIDMAAKIEE